MASERFLTATPMCWIFRIMSNLLANMGGHSRYYRRETRECPPPKRTWAPSSRGTRSAALEGVFASSLDVRETRTSALPLLRLLRPVPWTQGDAGGSTKRPVERMGGDTPQRWGGARPQKQ